MIARSETVSEQASPVHWGPPLLADLVTVEVAVAVCVDVTVAV